MQYTCPILDFFSCSKQLCCNAVALGSGRVINNTDAKFKEICNTDVVLTVAVLAAVQMQHLHKVDGQQSQISVAQREMLQIQNSMQQGILLEHIPR